MNSGRLQYDRELKSLGWLDGKGTPFSTFVPPVAIGGLGGSGTRLVATLLSEIHFDLGCDLNRAHDNLFFTFLFKRPELFNRPLLLARSLSVFVAVMNARRLSLPDQEWVAELAGRSCAEFDLAWGRLRCREIMEAGRQLQHNGGYWGWKEPNTHLHLPFLLQAMPRMKYIHVIRNGLDMAFSSNQLQLGLWGQLLLQNSRCRITPENALRFWCVAHRRIQMIKQHAPERVMLLNYDELCTSPASGVHKIERFLGLQLSRVTRQNMISSIRVPDTAGRYRAHNLKTFCPQDIEFVVSLGFHVD